MKKHTHILASRETKHLIFCTFVTSKNMRSKSKCGHFLCFNKHNSFFFVDAAIGLCDCSQFFFLPTPLLATHGNETECYIYSTVTQLNRPIFYFINTYMYMKNFLLHLKRWINCKQICERIKSIRAELLHANVLNILKINVYIRHKVI